MLPHWDAKLSLAKGHSIYCVLVQRPHV